MLSGAVPSLFFVPAPPLTPHLHRTSHLHPQGIPVPAQGTAVLPGWFSFHTSFPCHTRVSSGCIQEKGSDCKRFYCLPHILLYCLARHPASSHPKCHCRVQSSSYASFGCYFSPCRVSTLRLVAAPWVALPSTAKICCPSLPQGSLGEKKFTLR